MLLLDRIFPALATAGTLVGASTVMLAQATFTPNAGLAERIGGASLLLTAAVLIVRWTYRMWQETREAAKEDRDAALERERLLLEQITELNAQLNAERQLRLSLEQQGLSNRRHDPTEEA